MEEPAKGVDTVQRSEVYQCKMIKHRLIRILLTDADSSNTLLSVQGALIRQ